MVDRHVFHIWDDVVMSIDSVLAITCQEQAATWNEGTLTLHVELAKFDIARRESKSHMDCQHGQRNGKSLRGWLASTPVPTNIPFMELPPQVLRKWNKDEGNISAVTQKEGCHASTVCRRHVSMFLVHGDAVACQSIIADFLLHHQGATLSCRYKPSKDGQIGCKDRIA